MRQARALEVEPTGNVLKLRKINVNLLQLLKALHPKKVVLCHPHATAPHELVRTKEHLHALAALYWFRLQKITLKPLHQGLNTQHVDLLVGDPARPGASALVIKIVLQVRLFLSGRHQSVLRPQVLLAHVQGCGPCGAR